jgi:hypothetical protein
MKTFRHALRRKFALLFVLTALFACAAAAQNIRLSSPRFARNPVGKCLAKPVVTFRKKAPPVFRPFVDLFRRITGNYEPMIRSMTNMRCLALSRKAVYADSAENSAIIKVEATPVDNDPTDVLTVNYHVTGGKIVGTGRSVVWDLSGVAPGTYYIVAAADDGCGVCGTTITMEIQVKEKK